MSILAWLIGFAVILYLVALAALYLAQRSLIYPIPPGGRVAPGDAGFPEAEEHVLTTVDGERVILWHVPPRGDRATVMYFPGNGDVLAGCVGRFREITADGTGLIALSYRGYGGSTGKPSEEGLLRDAAAAYAFASARYQAKRIVAWGFSLGSGVAVAVGVEHPVGKLILEAPYTSIADMAASLFPFAPVRHFVKDTFRSDERMVRISVPLLVMHGARDSTIPILFGERLFELARAPKTFARFPEGGHDNLDQFGAIETARRFIGG
jgi:fermentation-respiration switch protein FrsA (DUF1100 family)